MKTMIAMATGLLIAGAASAQPVKFFVPPTLKQVASVDREKGQIVFIETITRLRPEVVEYEVIVKGKKELVVKTVQVPYFENQTMVFESVKCRFISKDDKQLAPGDVLKRLQKGTVVLVSANANTPPEEFLKAMSAEAIVILPSGPPTVLPPSPDKNKVEPRDPAK